jgi:hypothetical protein
VRSSPLISAENVRIIDDLASLYAFLLENHCIECIEGFDSRRSQARNGDAVYWRRAGDRTHLRDPLSAIRPRNRPDPGAARGAAALINLPIRESRIALVPAAT